MKTFHDHLELLTPSTWVTKDERRLQIRHMRDSHLQNVHRFLLRWASRQVEAELLELLSMRPPNGEFARDAFDEVCNEAAGQDAESYLAIHCPCWLAIVGEMMKRELRPL